MPAQVKDTVVIAMVLCSWQTHLEYALQCFRDASCQVPDLAARPRFAEVLPVRSLEG